MRIAAGRGRRIFTVQSSTGIYRRTTHVTITRVPLRWDSTRSVQFRSGSVLSFFAKRAAARNCAATPAHAQRTPRRAATHTCHTCRAVRRLPRACTAACLCGRISVARLFAAAAAPGAVPLRAHYLARRAATMYACRLYMLHYPLLSIPFHSYPSPLCFCCCFSLLR